MRIITERKLREFYQAYPAAQNSVRDWINKTRRADWHNFSDVRATFNSVDFHHGRLIFNVGDNNFRVIANRNSRCI